MKLLTEDDFGKTIMIGKKPLIEINAESLVFVETREQILKNQEKAEKWNRSLAGKDFNYYYEIVERLKKYLKNIDADILDKEKVHLCDEYSCEDNVREAIQKILGEKK